MAKWIESVFGERVKAEDGHFVLNGGPSLPTERCGVGLGNFRFLLCHGRSSQQLLNSCCLTA